MRRLTTRSMAILIALLPVGCSTTPPANPPAKQTVSDAKLLSLDSDGIRFLIESGASELLSVRPDDFAKQVSIPVELRGCDGDLPDVVFGKPTQRVADLSTVLSYDDPTTALRLVALEARDDRVKVRLSHIAMTYSANAEAWIRRENGKWRVAEVTARWRNL